MSSFESRSSSEDAAAPAGQEGSVRADLDDLFTERVTRSGLVSPEQLDLTRDVVDQLREAGEPATLVGMLLRRHYLTLSQANYILRESTDRVLYCDDCQSCRVVPLAELSIDLIACDRCGMDLLVSPADVLLLDIDHGAEERAAVEEDALIGESLKGFLIQERVTEGRYEGWYRASDPVSDRELMLRPIPTQFRRSKEMFKRLREDFYRVKLVNAAAKPELFELEQLGNNFYVTQAPISGRSIRELIEKRGPLPLMEAIPILKQVAELAVAGHRQDLIDFDFNADMIVLDDYGRVKSMDVSTGVLRSDDVDQMRWRAPERIAHKPVNEPADVWSFGAVAYYVLVGRPPFPGDDVMQVAEDVMHGRYVDIREAAPKLEPSMVELVQKTLSVAPSARIQDFSELLENLRHIPEIIRRREAEEAKQRELAARKTKVVNLGDLPGAASPTRGTTRLTAASLRERLGGDPATRRRVPPDKSARSHTTSQRLATSEPLPDETPAQRDVRLQIQEYGKRAREFMKLKRYTLAIKALNRILEFEETHPEFAGEVENAKKVIRLLEQQRDGKDGASS